MGVKRGGCYAVACWVAGFPLEAASAAAWTLPDGFSATSHERLLPMNDSASPGENPSHAPVEATKACRRGRSQRRRRAIPALLVATLVGLGIELLAMVLFGYVDGLEFSPQTFTRRRFVYFVLPPFNVQVTPIWRSTFQTPVEEQLIRRGWVAVMPIWRWDVVSGSRGPQPIAPQPAGILCGYLDLKDERGRYYWLDWNAEHPSEAAVLWPVVAAIARHGWYELLPDVLAAAREHAGSGRSEFQQALQGALQRQIGLLRPRLTPADRTTLDALCGEVSKQFAADEGRP